MPEENDEELDKALEALTAVYILSLVDNALETQIKSSVEALSELNTVRKAAGLEPVKIALEDMTASSIKDVEAYKKLLTENGGSYVVERVGDTEKLVFKPWLNKLKVETRKDIQELFKKAKLEEWTQSRIKDELSKIQELTINKRAYAAAFTESRVQQYQAQMRTWASGGLEYVQRHAVGGPETCAICLDLDRQVYKLGEESPLSHVNCRCFYSAYITKDAKY